MNEEIKLTDELTQEEIQVFEDRAKELELKYKVSKVYTYIGIDDETKERVVGYLREPNYREKLFLLDKMAMVGIFSAADELREMIVLKEESDYRTYSEDSRFDSYKLGVATVCVTIAEIVKNVYKKK